MDDNEPGNRPRSYWQEPTSGGCMKAIAILLAVSGAILVILVALLLLPAILMNMDPAFHERLPDASTLRR